MNTKIIYTTFVIRFIVLFCLTPTTPPTIPTYITVLPVQKAPDLAAVLPITCITPTDIVPTLVYLTTIQIELNSNTMSIASTTNPTYGNLVLTVPSDTYLTYGDNTFTAHVNLGLNTIYEDNASSNTMIEANIRHIIQRIHYYT